MEFQYFTGDSPLINNQLTSPAMIYGEILDILTGKGLKKKIDAINGDIITFNNGFVANEHTSFLISNDINSFIVKLKKIDTNNFKANIDLSIFSGEAYISIVGMPEYWERTVRETSSGNGMSLKNYRYGTLHLALNFDQLAVERIDGTRSKWANIEQNITFSHDNKTAVFYSKDCFIFISNNGAPLFFLNNKFMSIAAKKDTITGDFDLSGYNRAGVAGIHFQVLKMDNGGQGNIYSRSYSLNAPLPINNSLVISNLFVNQMPAPMLQCMSTKIPNNLQTNDILKLNNNLYFINNKGAGWIFKL